MHGRCDGFLVAVLASKSNSSGVLTSDKIFTKIISKENMSYRCRKSDALISCYAEGVSFENKVFGVGSESLSP
jgi:hypothetical protein